MLKKKLLVAIFSALVYMIEKMKLIKDKWVDRHKPVKRRSGHDMIDSGLIFYDHAGCTWHASSLPMSIHDFYILYLEGVTIVMHKEPVPIHCITAKGLKAWQRNLEKPHQVGGAPPARTNTGF